jgi:hypothetical protein
MIRAFSLAVCLSLFVLAYVQARELPTDCPRCMTASELAAEAEDFTDSGVGCVDDCLALEPFTNPETVPDEYMLEPDEYTAWDDYLEFKEQNGLNNR